MSRFAVRSACFLVGFALVVGSAAPWGLGQQPDPKKADPKKADPKDAKKADPKKVDPKDAKKVDPKKADPKKADPKDTKKVDPTKKVEPKKVGPKTPTPKPPEPKVTEPEPLPPFPDGPPNPLDLVRGLREQGMSDLALEYLRDLAAKPTTAPAVKAEIPLERAKCQLEAADDEPDEGTRASLIGEAKEGFGTFLKANPKHPRAPEANIALARLTSLDARAQLSRARRIDVPPAGTDDQARDTAIARQRVEAAKARPMFETAAKQFLAAVKQLEAQLTQTTDLAARRRLADTLYDAELAQGINQFSLSEAYLHPTNAEIKERGDKLDAAREIFAALADRDRAPARVTGVARAWMAECLFAQEKATDAEAEVKRIEASAGPDAEDAKRMVRFFNLRRKIRAADSLAGFQTAEAMCRDWLRHYGTVRRAQAEAYAVRYYLANVLQLQGDLNMPKAPATPPKNPTPVTVPPAARSRYAEAEKLYRQIAQADNEFTDRAGKQRLAVVRRLLGEADQPPTAYKTFEECQMASLIQMGKVLDLERDPGKQAEAKEHRHKVVALLERARDLATPQDNPADVADVMLRLIYFYQMTGQPYQAAVLAEHMARAVKTTEAEKLDAARRSDRERAMRLARFLDEKFPNDPATDHARFRLAVLLYEDGKLLDAYDATLKVRPGFEQIANARLFQGGLASQLLTARDLNLPDARRREIFARTTADLDKLAKPLPAAAEADVRAYITARCRLALLYLLRPRVEGDPKDFSSPKAFALAAESYGKARAVAEEALALVPTYQSLVQGATTKALKADGWEMKLQAEDARTRAIFLQGDALFREGKYDDAYKAIGDVLADMNQAGPYAQQVKAMGTAKPPEPKTPEPKAAPEPKKGPDPKKDAAAKKEPEKKEPEKKEPEPATEPTDAEASSAELAQITKLADGVDKLRRDLVVLALKIRVKQGQAEKGVEQLELLKRYGGSIEANVGTLEQVTAEMAGQIMALRREGKADEARALGDGFAKLLDRVSAEPNLPASVQLFLGQALILVGQYDKAISALQKVPAPADKGALAKPNEIKDNPNLRKQVLEYRRGALELTRAYRKGGKFAEADALLADAMGTPEKQGWAFSSVDFRKEVASLHEAKGAAEPDPKKANAEWSGALREWSTIFNIYRNALQKLPAAPVAGGGGGQRQALMNSYFEAFFDVQRCLVKANKQLLAGPQFATKLQKTFDDVGKRFADLERASEKDLTQEVREIYHDLLMEEPELKKSYEAAGGKLFLEKPAASGVGGM